MALFRAGHDEAFRVIHDRYRQRLFAYTRQMLPRRQDAEDALQDVFVRAFFGLRANDGELALRAWLYRVAHNRCIDELRRPSPPPPEVIELVRSPIDDPIAQADQRESFRRLIADVRRLPEKQRSALLMRELGGMSYTDMAAVLGTSVPAVKSLLVRARMTLAQALEARDTACSDIREALVLAHDRGVRPNAMARRHIRECSGCREFRRDLRGVRRQLAALVPPLGPLGGLARVLHLPGAGGGTAGGAAAAVGGVAGSGGAAASAGGLFAGAGHVVTLIAAAVITAGGAVEIQHTFAPQPVHHHHARRASARGHGSTPPSIPGVASVAYPDAQTAEPAAATASAAPASHAPMQATAPAAGASTATQHATTNSGSTGTADTTAQTGAGTSSGSSTSSCVAPSSTTGYGSSTTSASGSSGATDVTASNDAGSADNGTVAQTCPASASPGAGSSTSEPTGAGAPNAGVATGTPSGSGTSSQPPTSTGWQNASSGSSGTPATSPGTGVSSGSPSSTS